MHRRAVERRPKERKMVDPSQHISAKARCEEGEPRAFHKNVYFLEKVMRAVSFSPDRQEKPI